MAETRRYSEERERPPDVVIAVMGETGAGKSEFVQRVTGIADVPVNHGMAPEAKDIIPYDFWLQVSPTQADQPLKLRLIDCPGFDDASKPDREIINSILEYLKKTYNDKQKLHGIIYMIPIYRARLYGCTRANLAIFRELCGNDFYRNVVLGTTFWDEEVEHRGMQREEELKSTPHFWGTMCDRGSQVERLGREPRRHGLTPEAGATLAREKGLRILRDIARNSPKWLQAQVEMSRGWEASETSAMREHNEWQDQDRKIELLREQYRRKIDRRHAQNEEARLRARRRMERGFQEQQERFARDRALLHTKQRDLRGLVERSRQWLNRNSIPTAGSRNIRELVEEKDRLEADTNESRRRELTIFLQRCKRHKDGLPTKCQVRCSGQKGTCNKVIDTNRDQYYHCCYCDKDRLWHCFECGDQCGRSTHPTMFTLPLPS